MLWPRRGISPLIEALASMVVIAPAQKVLLDAADSRESLAAQRLTTEQVSVGLNLCACGSSQRVGQLRREGKLLGVYVTRPAPSYRYPNWQFGPDGLPIDHLADILKVLCDFGPFQRELHGLHRTTGWGEVEWFLSPHVLLHGMTPASTLMAAPANVLRAARVEFQGTD